MANRELSKRNFAATLEQLLETTSIDKVRVTQLARKAQTTPQAFYYHFKDKYDLVAWIYLQDYAAALRDSNEAFSPQQIMRLTARFERRKTFYRRAFADKSQNAIKGYVDQHSFAMAQKAVEANQHAPLTPKQSLAIRYHQFGVMGLFKMWLFGQLDTSPQQLADLEYQRTPDFLKAALSHYHFIR